MKENKEKEEKIKEYEKENEILKNRDIYSEEMIIIKKKW